MEKSIQLTVLGSGTSMGVPTLACHCAVCASTDARDKRLRPSLLLSRNRENVVIDTTPDFRTQALRARLDRLDAVLLTHGHADHILGFDDLRPYNFRQGMAMPVYGSEETFAVLRRVFAYVFDDKPTLSAVPSVVLHDVKGPFELLGIPIIPVPLLHGELDVLGYRFGRAAYLTDFSRLPESSVPLLEDLDELIVDGLRDLPHPMHQTVEQALLLIDRLRPKRAWLTHVAHDLGHAATNERLRKAGYEHVALAYDGLQLEVATESPAVERAAKALAVQVHIHTGKMSTFYSAADWLAKFGVDRGGGESGENPRPRYGERTWGTLGETQEKSGGTQDPPANCEDGAPEEKDQEKSKPAPLNTKGAAPDDKARKGGGRGSVIAIGNFDGIHLGHQRVLEFTIGKAKESGAVATALTFEPPPLKILRPAAAPLRISTNQQRMEWFGAVGMEAAVVLPFTKELSELSPEDFVDQILVQQMKVLAVVVGENFRFGHRGAGDVRLLRELGMRYGFEVVVHASVAMDKEIVSSTLIRKLIADGDVTHAARLLGRPFVLTGEVVAGTGTGRKFTFPTMNLLAEQELLPGRGVYITRTVLEGEPNSHRSVTNVGMRPTFDGKGLTVETHLLDYSGNFAPQRIEIRFWKKLRDEKKFAGAEELKAQIARDILKANRFFGRLRAFKSSRFKVQGSRV